MKNKGCFHFQALCLIFSGLMLQHEAVAEAESAVVAVYKFKEGTKPFTLYKEPYAEPSVETSKSEEKPKIQETDMKPMEIGRPEPRKDPPPNPQQPSRPQPEEERVESYHRKETKNPQRPTIMDPSVFEPSKSTTSEPLSSLFNFENLGFIQPAFAEKLNQPKQITPGEPYPLPHKVFWNQGVGTFQKKRSFLVKTIPSNGLCEEGFNPIEIQELDSRQPAKQRCVKQDESVLIEVSKDEGLTVLNGKSAPIWKEKGMEFQTQDKEYLEQKRQRDFAKLEEKYAKERVTLEKRYENEKTNLKARYGNVFYMENIKKSVP
ncbi:MAG: hypothetical protein ACRCYP_01265 [Alphaproteobacteria bacterium]